MQMSHDSSLRWLFVKNQRRIHAYILTVVPDYNEAADLFQQTSMLLWENCRKPFRPMGDFVRWACHIALNVVRNYRVKKRSRPAFVQRRDDRPDRRRSFRTVGVAGRGVARHGQTHGRPRSVRAATLDTLLSGRSLDSGGL